MDVYEERKSLFWHVRVGTEHMEKTIGRIDFGFSGKVSTSMHLRFRFGGVGQRHAGILGGFYRDEYRHVCLLVVSGEGV